MLRVRSSRVRSRRPAADAHLRHARPRHGHERVALRAAELGRRPALRPRQGAHLGGARGRARVRPLSRHRRRRRPVPHLSGHAPDERRLLHPAPHGTAMPAIPKRARSTSTTCSASCASSRRPRAWSQSRSGRMSAPDPFRRGLFRVDGSAMHEAIATLQAKGIDLDLLRVRALPVLRRGDRLRPRARPGLPHRTEPRRPAADAPRHRRSDRPGTRDLRAALRRHADHGPFHRRRDRRAGARSSTARHAGRRRNDLSRKPAAPSQARRNPLGFSTRRDYEGAVSTLCAGCGHDSISAAIIQACFELAIPPHRVAKLGIGCSSKTPTYFLGASHGFNSVHGRMPSVLTGAALANRDLIYLGVSGDGDLGFDRPWAIRPLPAARGQHDLYRREQRRLRVDQANFPRPRTRERKSKKGVGNQDLPIDLVSMAILLGAVRGAQLFRRQAQSCR